VLILKGVTEFRTYTVQLEKPLDPNQDPVLIEILPQERYEHLMYSTNPVLYTFTIRGLRKKDRGPLQMKVRLADHEGFFQDFT
jgi:hypothetical protein